MSLVSTRTLAALGAFMCLAALLTAYFFFQKYMGLEPCPLCIIDRWIVAALGCGFLCVAISSKFILKVTALCWNFIFIILAFITGGRHLWLEANPPPLDESGGCSPGGQKIQSVIEWLSTAFVGTSDCSTVPWSLFGLSVAGWTMVFFVALALLLSLTAITCYQDRHKAA